MKAKTYYIHPKDMHSTKADSHDGCVKVHILPASALDKVIERAARVMAGHAQWVWLDKPTKAYWRSQARDAYKAGGFEV